MLFPWQGSRTHCSLRGISSYQTQMYFCHKCVCTDTPSHIPPDGTLQMDLIESTLFTSPIVLLQTVMEEVRHRSLPLYNRLKALSKADEKKICIFYNEYRSCVPVLSREVKFSSVLVKPQSYVRKTKHQMIGTIEACIIELYPTSI